MASVEESIYSILTSDGGVSALVSSRVYPVILPQNPTYPALTYTILTGLEYPAMGSDVDTSEVRVQVSCWAETYSAAKALAVVVKSALNRNRGVTAGVDFKGTYKQSEVDLFESEINVYQKALDFQVFYEVQ